MIFIPFKDSNLLYNDLFQECVKRMYYINISDTRLFGANNRIDKKENFWGPSRIDITVVYQDKNTEKAQAQTVHLILNPEQVKPCSESDQLSQVSSTGTSLIIYSLASVGFIIIIIIILLIIFLRRKKAKKPKTGVDTNPEYGADYYYKQNDETYGETVQYTT